MVQVRALGRLCLALILLLKWVVSQTMLLGGRRRLGMRMVAIYSDADALIQFVRETDRAVRIGPQPERKSYLDHAAIM